LSLNNDFLVVLAVRLSSGNFWPPYPCLRLSWRREPHAIVRAFPAL
jgi:hypothetical protein